jgi:hypothetical protein
MASDKFSLQEFMMKAKFKMSLIAAVAVMVMAVPVWAAVFSIPFFSQRDSAWSATKLGSSTTLTIGSHGCAMTSVACLLKFRGADCDPAKLNTYLKDNSGYDSNSAIKWDVAAKFGSTQWLNYKGKSTLPSLATLSKDLDAGKLIVAESSRFGSQTHFVVIRGVTTDNTQGYYWDPYDTSATQRRIGDGWVNVGSGTRVFTK